MKPSAEELRSLLYLDPETGNLYWKHRGPEWFDSSQSQTRATKARRWNTRYAGAPALHSLNCGYRKGRILGQPIVAHVVVFAIHNGFYAPEEVDHINGDTLDNRPLNLRQATHQQNCQNRAAKRGSSSAYRGVKRSGKKWEASIGHTYLGTFDDETDAASAYFAAATARYGEFVRAS